MTMGRYKFQSHLHSADILERRLSVLLAPAGVTPRQARILSMLARLDVVSQTSLTEQFDVTSGSMSTMLDKLLKLEMITRDLKFALGGRVSGPGQTRLNRSIERKEFTP